MKSQHVGDIVAMVVADTALEARDARRIDQRDMGRASRRDRHGRGLAAGRAAHLRRARRATSPTTPISATSRRRTRLSPAQRTRFASKSSIRAWSPIIWSRARAVGEYDPKSGRLTLNLGSQGVHGIQGAIAGAMLKIPPNPFASSRKTSAAGSAPRPSSIGNIRLFSRRRSGSDGASAGSPIAASISSATRKAATM